MAWPAVPFASLFQFYKVRLKHHKQHRLRVGPVISILQSSIKTRKARIQEAGTRKFQFYKVRLKRVWRFYVVFADSISILQSSIKTKQERETEAREVISILQSSIKTKKREKMIGSIIGFQFYKVRLKLITPFLNIVGLKFQFYKVRLKPASGAAPQGGLRFQFYKVRLKLPSGDNAGSFWLYFNSTKFD